MKLQDDKYEKTFYGREFQAALTPDILHRALLMMIETRKFEIELYWKRANHFWVFNSLVFAGYGGTLFVNAVEEELRALVLAVLACVGIVTSFGWFLANKGSKYWQQNWEYHLDLLEDRTIGPLYKTVFEEKRANNSIDFLVSAGRFSVSKINQMISFFVFALWVFLLLVAFRFPPCYSPIFIKISFVVATFICCALLYKFGKTGKGNVGVTPFARSTVVD